MSKSSGVVSLNTKITSECCILHSGALPNVLSMRWCRTQSSEVVVMNGQPRQIHLLWEHLKKKTKNNGSFKQLHVKSKVVPLFAYPEAVDRFPVKILDQYIHQQASTGHYCIGLVLCSSTRRNSTRSIIPLVHWIKRLRTCAYKPELLETRWTTVCVQLVRPGAPEKLIQEKTGHRSLEALKAYEQTDSSQHQAVSISYLLALVLIMYKKHKEFRLT